MKDKLKDKEANLWRCDCSKNNFSSWLKPFLKYNYTEMCLRCNFLRYDVTCFSRGTRITHSFSCSPKHIIPSVSITIHIIFLLRNETIFIITIFYILQYNITVYTVSFQGKLLYYYNVTMVMFHFMIFHSLQKKIEQEEPLLCIFITFHVLRLTNKSFIRRLLFE